MKGYFYPWFSVRTISKEDIEQIYATYPNAIGYATIPEDASWDAMDVCGPVFASKEEAEIVSFNSYIELDEDEFIKK